MRLYGSFKRETYMFYNAPERIMYTAYAYTQKMIRNVLGIESARYIFHIFSQFWSQNIPNELFNSLENHFSPKINYFT